MVAIAWWNRTTMFQFSFILSLNCRVRLLTVSTRSELLFLFSWNTTTFVVGMTNNLKVLLQTNVDTRDTLSVQSKPQSCLQIIEVDRSLVVLWVKSANIFLKFIKAAGPNFSLEFILKICEWCNFLWYYVRLVIRGQKDSCMELFNKFCYSYSKLSIN